MIPVLSRCRCRASSGRLSVMADRPVYGVSMTPKMPPMQQTRTAAGRGPMCNVREKQPGIYSGRPPSAAFDCRLPRLLTASTPKPHCGSHRVASTRGDILHATGRCSPSSLHKAPRSTCTYLLTSTCSGLVMTDICVASLHTLRGLIMPRPSQYVQAFDPCCQVWPKFLGSSPCPSPGASCHIRKGDLSIRKCHGAADVAETREGHHWKSMGNWQWLARSQPARMPTRMPNLGLTTLARHPCFVDGVAGLRAHAPPRLGEQGERISPRLNRRSTRERAASTVQAWQEANVEIAP